MGGGNPEDRHRPVPVELVDRPAVPLDLLGHQLVVGEQELSDVLRIERLRPLREADQVAEHDRADPALLADRGELELAATSVAELRTLDVLVTAGRADKHGSATIGDRSRGRLQRKPRRYLVAFFSVVTTPFLTVTL